MLFQQRAQRAWRGRPGSDQRFVNSGDAVVMTRPGGGGKRPAGFVHQKIGSGKVPIAAITACECSVESSAATRAKRSATECTSGATRIAGAILAKRSVSPFGPPIHAPAINHQE